MEKINVAELLRNCPSGMKLDCVLVDNLYFDCINDSELDDPYPIQCYTQSGSYRTSIRFNEYGHYTLMDNSKCVIFPVGKTTWEGFVPPCQFKDGDILAYTSTNTTVFIYRNKDNEPKHTTSFYVGYTIGGSYRNFHIYDKSLLIALNGDCDTRFATEEEKEKLFQAIKDNGYEWNEETKTLEKLPKFKDGDVIFTYTGYYWISIFKQFSGNICCTYVDLYINNNDLITDTSCLCYKGEIKIQRLATEDEKEKLFQAIKDKGYRWNSETKTLEKLNEPKFKAGDKVRVNGEVFEPRIIEGQSVTIYSLQPVDKIDTADQDGLVLFPNKFDITTLVPFESRVLVRNDKDQYWIPAFWGYKCADGYTTTYGWCKYCIPFEGNEHLLESNKECDKFYRTWEKTGD